MSSAISARDLRSLFLRKEEVALLDLRDEDVYARAHPLFAAQLPPHRLEIESPLRLPRREGLVVLYDGGEGLVEGAAKKLRELGYRNVAALEGGLAGWRAQEFELFQDVNSYCKAFGELVEAKRHTPSLSAQEVSDRLREGRAVVVLDARRFEEYRTMCLPGAVSVPGAELVLRAPAMAPDAGVTVVVNCAGRTRSLIGAQSLINAGLANPVFALRNGTMGWTLAGLDLEVGAQRREPEVMPEQAALAGRRAREVAIRAGVRRIDPGDLARMAADAGRGLYRFDVRRPEEVAAGHIPGFCGVPGGQLVQETDFFAPMRGARVVLADDLGPRADMTASWLAQMAWDVYVLEGGFEGSLETGPGPVLPSRPPQGRYRRPYEGADNPKEAMQAYLDWEFGLVAQLERDGTHGFFVI